MADKYSTSNMQIDDTFICVDYSIDMKPVRITRELVPKDAVFNISAKLLQRKERVKRINEALKRSG